MRHLQREHRLDNMWYLVFPPRVDDFSYPVALGLIRKHFYRFLSYALLVYWRSLLNLSESEQPGGSMPVWQERYLRDCS